MHFFADSPSMNIAPYHLVLGSSSPARKMLLEKLHIPFTTCSPDIDESDQPNETPQQLVQRLAKEKAYAVATQLTPTEPTLIIGGDQVAVVDDMITGKPHTHEKAIATLKAMSGKVITYYNGLCLYDPLKQREQISLTTTDVHFRALSDELIETYLQKDQPYQCAGGFRSEGMGIVLAEKYVSDDPNALVGLPLISLLNMLKKWGLF